ncbi:MAG: phospho-N-acetylmuramoyl-pentapeptide-transferase [Acidobacteria bacterium]|nr:phospho-N-acetylmuramoyl-pentapeptide-transferase [Acidobacteriota bacterium]
MIADLLYKLSEHWGLFNVFKYITFRAALAVITSLIISLALGSLLIRRLQQFQIGQHIREEGPKSHQSKAGTPTMGGILIIISIVISVLLWGDWSNKFLWIVTISLIGFALIGGLDDYIKIVKKRNKGLSAKMKFGSQIILSGAIGTVLYLISQNDGFNTVLHFPFFKTLTPELGLLFIPFVIIVIAGSSNAVNLTDGLDGLAVGSVMIAAAAYAVFAYAAGNAVVSDYLNIAFVKGVGEITVFMSALLGACIGFLWFNCHPAQVFMGDVGSLSLGGVIGTIAVLCKQEILLVIVGGIFVMEALSVIIQVFSYKTTGKRVFKMAPLHHHFELSGWSESKVVVRFWILAILFALVSLTTLKLR